MSAEIWRSEVVLYGFMILNVLGVGTALVWAWRRGQLTGLDDTTMQALGLRRPGGGEKENCHG